MKKAGGKSLQTHTDRRLVAFTCSCTERLVRLILWKKPESATWTPAFNKRVSSLSRGISRADPLHDHRIYNTKHSSQPCITTLAITHHGKSEARNEDAPSLLSNGSAKTRNLWQPRPLGGTILVLVARVALLQRLTQETARRNAHIHRHQHQAVHARLGRSRRSPRGRTAEMGAERLCLWRRPGALSAAECTGACWYTRRRAGSISSSDHE